jgi:methyl-accepting chemotaxis protein
MSSGVTHAAQGVELSRQAGAAIAQIRSGAERVSETLQGITGAVREQSAAGQSIAQGVESIAHMTEQNVDEAKRSAAIARDLQALSAALHTSIGRFKV